MQASSWKAATVDIDRGAEFANDDVDQYSSLVDLGENYEFLSVFVPALDANAGITVYLQRDDSIATVPVILTTFKSNGIGHFVLQTGTGAGSLVAIFRIGGCQFVRVRANANQDPDIAFYVRGYNR